MAEEGGGKKFPVMLIVGLIVVGLILAGGISYFIATKVIATKGDSGGKASHEPGVFLKLGDPKDGLILNIGGPTSGRYLKIGVVLELKPDKKGAAPGGKGASPDEIKALDAVVQLLRSQRVEDFDPAKQERLKDQIKAEVNRALGEERVYEVFITNFVLQ
ncbi:MAG TPA: flagellar basal body-associated FliL family protein [Negativicutes bacterium]|nr:flagellar basal body-associated FliL family protein [Negativicutes bacterium]